MFPFLPQKMHLALGENKLLIFNVSKVLLNIMTGLYFLSLFCPSPSLPGIK